MSGGPAVYMFLYSVFYFYTKVAVGRAYPHYSCFRCSGGFDVQVCVVVVVFGLFPRNSLTVERLENTASPSLRTPALVYQEFTSLLMLGM